jgi:hypothetical protein
MVLLPSRRPVVWFFLLLSSLLPFHDLCLVVQLLFRVDQSFSHHLASIPRVSYIESI